MPLKTEGIEEPSLNLTPMIDIVFLLIIFFMVGAQFTEAERELEINLPTAATTTAVTSLPDPATVNVREDGLVFLGTDQITVPDLERRLVAMKQNYPGQAVLLRGDGATNYQTVMDVLAACRRAGITSLSLANRVAPPE